GRRIGAAPLPSTPARSRGSVENSTTGENGRGVVRREIAHSRVPVGSAPNALSLSKKQLMASNQGRRRVVVTGMGAVTPIGNTLPEYWNGLIEGRSGADYITRFDATNYETRFACEVKNFDAAV